MRLIPRKAASLLASLVLAAGVTAISSFASDKPQTFTGEVGDTMCGAKHEMAGDAAACTRGCISHGSKYALIVGDKVYTLETSDKAALSELDKLAGAKAQVKGTASGTTIQVASVAAAK